MTLKNTIVMACASASVARMPAASAQLPPTAPFAWSSRPPSRQACPTRTGSRPNPKNGFFAYFRWYSPTRAFFDRSWKMGNIVEVK